MVLAIIGIQMTLGQLDVYKRQVFGRTNYNKTVSSYKENKHFYNECVRKVVAFCEEQGISYHIKEKTKTKE